MAEQAELEGMPKRLYSAAPTRLLTFLDCPRRYRFSYLDRPPPPKGPPWAHNSLGSAVHNALAEWWRLPLERRTVEAAGDLVESGWLTQGFRNDRQALQQRDRARDMVERYVADLDPADEPVGIERVVGLTTPRASLWGRVDRIDDRPEGLVIVDYKTGRHALTVDDARASLPMAVYAAATARTLRRPCLRVELHHLPTGEVLAWDHTEESLARQLRRADSLAAEVARSDQAFRQGLSEQEADEAFPARPGPICGWCDFNRVCGPGSAVRSPLDPWAGVPADE